MFVQSSAVVIRICRFLEDCSQAHSKYCFHTFLCTDTRGYISQHANTPVILGCKAAFTQHCTLISTCILMILSAHMLVLSTIQACRNSHLHT